MQLVLHCIKESVRNIRSQISHKMDDSLERCDVSDEVKRASVGEEIEYCFDDMHLSSNPLNRTSDDSSDSSKEESNNDKISGTGIDMALKITGSQGDAEGSSKGDEADTSAVVIPCDPLNDDNTDSVARKAEHESISNDSNLSIIPKQSYSYGK